MSAFGWFRFLLVQRRSEFRPVRLRKITLWSSGGPLRTRWPRTGTWASGNTD